MTGNSNSRAKRRKAGALGQSSRMFLLSPCKDAKKVGSSQGTGIHNPSMGSLLTLTRRIVKNAT